MKTGYITNSFSTLGGLASVAYGDPEYFREVQNQIYSESPTSFLDMHRPSAILSDFFASPEQLTSAIVSELEDRYNSDPEFNSYIDVNIGPNWKNNIMEKINTELPLVIDSVEDYGATMSDYLNITFSRVLPNAPSLQELSIDIAKNLENIKGAGVDIPLMTRIISNNPQTKLSVPPVNARINLKNSADTGSDLRGVEFTKGYITPQDYWKDIAYPGLTSSATPIGFRDIINQGYVNYPSITPLENLFNPIGAQSISDTDIESEISSPAGSAASYLSQFPEVTNAERQVYNISLIGELINGLTTFDPATMSNGNLIDLNNVPDEENSDPQGGSTPSTRNFQPAF